MIPASILLVILVCADLVSHVALWLRAHQVQSRMEDMVREAFAREHGAIVKVEDYDRNNSDIQHEIKRLRAWSKMPDEFKF